MSVSFSAEPSGHLTQPRKFSLRSQFPLHQHPLWKIEVGAVRSITWLEDGTTVTMALWGPGDLVGAELSHMDPYEFECLTPVEAVPLSGAGELLSRDLLLTYLKRAEELIVIRSYRRMDEMLIRLLGWLSRRFGREIENGNLIDLRLTHQDLADILGTTRVTVTRLLGQFEEQGRIERLSLHRIVLRETESWYYEI